MFGTSSPLLHMGVGSAYPFNEIGCWISCNPSLGPSPDWLVGVDSLNLCLKDCSWTDRIEMDLYPFDAGTDSGITYMVSRAHQLFLRSTFLPYSLHLASGRKRAENTLNLTNLKCAMRWIFFTDGFAIKISTH